MKKILISLGVISSLLQVVKAADLPILSDSYQPFSFAVTSLTEQVHLPLFVSVGNHDKNAGGTPYTETVLPLSHRLSNWGNPLARYGSVFGMSEETR